MYCIHRMYLCNSQFGSSHWSSISMVHKIGGFRNNVISLSEFCYTWSISLKMSIDLATFISNILYISLAEKHNWTLISNRTSNLTFTNTYTIRKWYRYHYLICTPKFCTYFCLSPFIPYIYKQRIK